MKISSSAIIFASLAIMFSSSSFANNFNDLIAWDLEQVKVRTKLETATGEEKIKLTQRWFQLCNQGKIMQYIQPYADCEELIAPKQTSSSKQNNQVKNSKAQGNKTQNTNTQLQSSKYLSVFKYAVLEKATPEDSKELTNQVKIEVTVKNTSNYHVTGRWGAKYYPGRAEKYINNFDRCMIEYVADFGAELNDAIYGIRECQIKTNQLPHLNARFE